MSPTRKPAPIYIVVGVAAAVFAASLYWYYGSLQDIPGIGGFFTLIPGSDELSEEELATLSPEEILIKRAGDRGSSPGTSSAHPESTYGRVTQIDDQRVTIEFIDGSAGTHLLDGKQVTFSFSGWGDAKQTGVASVEQGDLVRISWWPDRYENGSVDGSSIMQVDDNDSGLVNRRAVANAGLE